MHAVTTRPSGVGGWRRRTACGVTLTTLALGLRQAFVRREPDAVAADAAGEPPGPPAALELHFDPRGPDDTWAVARPWLLGRAAR